MFGSCSFSINPKLSLGEKNQYFKGAELLIEIIAFQLATFSHGMLQERLRKFLLLSLGKKIEREVFNAWEHTFRWNAFFSFSLFMGKKLNFSFRLRRAWRRRRRRRKKSDFHSWMAVLITIYLGGIKEMLALEKVCSFSWLQLFRP